MGDEDAGGGFPHRRTEDLARMHRRRVHRSRRDVPDSQDSATHVQERHVDALAQRASRHVPHDPGDLGAILQELPRTQPLRPQPAREGEGRHDRRSTRRPHPGPNELAG